MPVKTVAVKTVEATYNFYCYICEEPSTEICVYCTKDCCGLHRCEKCLRCTDCCVCHLENLRRA
jgi:hypothetical protein